MIVESLMQEAVRELGAVRCASCGGAKARGKSFCGACWYALPEGLRRGLWKTLSEGYATAYDEAKEWLRVNTKI